MCACTNCLLVQWLEVARHPRAPQRSCTTNYSWEFARSVCANEFLHSRETRLKILYNKTYSSIFLARSLALMNSHSFFVCHEIIFHQARSPTILASIRIQWIKWIKFTKNHRQLSKYVDRDRHIPSGVYCMRPAFSVSRILYLIDWTTLWLLSWIQKRKSFTKERRPACVSLHLPNSIRYRLARRKEITNWAENSPLAHAHLFYDSSFAFFRIWLVNWLPVYGWV